MNRPDGADQPNDRGAAHDDVEAFADAFDRSFRDAARREPRASALDPQLWSRIEQGARPTERSVVSGPARQEERVGRQGRVTPTRPDDGSRRSSIPSTQWRRGVAAFAMVALTCLAVFLLSTVRDREPQFAGVVRDAPQVVSPAAIEVEGCVAEPLTVEEVLAIVINPSGDEPDPFALFPSPPMIGEVAPHTETWLPEDDGRVEMWAGTRQVRPPTPDEFAALERAVNHYLACQEEGSNFQLWGLESEYEVQRQVLEALPEEVTESVRVEVTEPMLIDTIERLGPVARYAVRGSYMTFSYRHQPYAIEVNPMRDAAYVTDDQPQYAWIGTQLRNTETDVLVARRGGGLSPGETYLTTEGAPEAPGALILRYDAGRKAWVVEWFVPYV